MQPFFAKLHIALQIKDQIRIKAAHFDSVFILKYWKKN